LFHSPSFFLLLSLYISFHLCIPSSPFLFIFVLLNDGAQWLAFLLRVLNVANLHLGHATTYSDLAFCGFPFSLGEVPAEYPPVSQYHFFLQPFHFNTP
jgi:hypothetical protein